MIYSSKSIIHGALDQYEGSKVNQMTIGKQNK